MTNHFPTVAIFVTATSFAGFAIWLGVDPNALLEAFGIESRTPQMATEIRAFYGGVEMAIALAMLLLWWRGDLFAALLIGGLPLAGSATGRCLGILVDGFSQLHAGFALLEFIGAAACLAGCAIVSKQTVRKENASSSIQTDRLSQADQN